MSAPEAAPRDAAAHIEGLIDIAASLNLILEQENEAMAGDGDVAHLQAEKARLAAAFAHSVRAVAMDRAGACGADPALLNRLREIAVTFEANASSQHAMLDGAKE